MLAPFLLDFEEDLVAFANVLSSLTNFAHSCIGARVAQIDPPLAWLTEAQMVFAHSLTAAQAWENAQPQIASPVAQGLLAYAALFAGAAQTLTPTSAVDDWVAVLSALEDQAKSNSQDVRTVTALIAGRQVEFHKAYQELKDAVSAAQAGSAAEAADLAQAEGLLQSLLDQLAGYGTGTNSAALAAGKTLVQTAITVTYAVAAAGSAAVPYITIVATVVTVGESVEVLVSNDAKVTDLLHQLSQTLERMQDDQAALAATKALLYQLEGMEDAYVSAAGSAPRLNGYWDAESAKLQVVLQALRAGSDPAKLNEILEFPAAATIWETLAKVGAGFALPSVTAAAQVALTIPSGSTAQPVSSTLPTEFRQESTMPKPIVMNIRKRPATPSAKIAPVTAEQAKNLFLVAAAAPAGTSSGTPTVDTSAVQTKGQAAFMAMHIVTTGAQAVANTFLGPIDTVSSTDPTIKANLDKIAAALTDIEAKLATAKITAGTWLPGSTAGSGLCARLSATIPNHILDYGATYDAVSDEILTLLDQAKTASPDAKKTLTAQALDMIQNGLLSSVQGYQTETAAAATALGTYVSQVQADHDALLSGAGSIQNLIGIEQSEAKALGDDITRLNDEIAAYNKQIMDAEIGVGVSIFVGVVGVALCATGVGAAAGGVLIGVGILGTAASATVWGVLEAKVKNDENQIAQEQATEDQLNQQATSLTGLHTTVSNLLGQIEQAQSALSDVATFWQTFGGVLSNIVKDLEKPDADLSVVMDEIWVKTSKTQWAQLVTFAQSLVATTVTTEIKPAAAA